MSSLSLSQPVEAHLTPIHSEERHAFVDKLIARRQFVPALAQLKFKLEANPLDLETLDRAAECYFQIGDTKTAIAMLGFLIENCPGNSS